MKILGLFLANIACLIMQASSFAMTVVNKDAKPHRIRTVCAMQTPVENGQTSTDNCSFCYSLETLLSPGRSRSFQCTSNAGFAVYLGAQRLETGRLDRVVISGGRLSK